ncbi:MAG: hypothetical protein CBC16_06830 [Verrucomicrobia bacterium TMED56]|nr:MAG: hypothetical protein CBC16_06830 [Verrucomicrobia bacterium TMED56]|tara:strand:+ start:237 stop:1889 length:1653 start_codon:yes stop_codon:yes gene_type:complete
MAKTVVTLTDPLSTLVTKVNQISNDLGDVQSHFLYDSSMTGMITKLQHADDLDSAAIRGLISISNAGGLGSIAYNNSTGVLTYTGVSAFSTVSDLSPQLGGDLDVNGKRIIFGDTTNASSFDDKLVFGADSDLKIYHDASNNSSFIKEVGSGSLRLLGTHLNLSNAANAKDYITCTDGGAVTLAHNGTTKLATASGGVTITGTATATTFVGALTGSASGNAATATALQNARTIHGVSFNGTGDIDLSEVIQDTVGAMFTSNTETGITATYQDGDGTIDLVVGTSLNTSGNAATATALQNARNIGGVSFDGTGDITLPGVNTGGNQNTSGIAAEATILENTRTIALTGDVAGSVTFNGSSNVSMSTTIQSNSVALGTDTTGDYVYRVAAGTGVGVSSTSGEGSHPSISIGQSVGTGNHVQFHCLGLGVTASGVSGELRATGNITAYYSDERLKDMHGKIENALDKVELVNGYYFKENKKAKELGYDNDDMQVGVSAQEIEKILPEVIDLAPISEKEGVEENYKTVHYDKLVPLLIEAIKELNQKVKDLENK